MRIRAAIALLSFGLLLSGGAAVGQNASTIINMFGGIMQSAMIQAAQAEWRKSSPTEPKSIINPLRAVGRVIDNE